MVVMVGVDVHKDTHCAVVVDEAGGQLGKPVTVRATEAGHLQLLRCGWSRALLRAGQKVRRVPPKLMANTRTSARTRGKSDPIDALAIARAAVREGDLALAEHSHLSPDSKVLVEHREDLVGNRTQLDPSIDPKAPQLDSTSELDRVQARLEQIPRGG